VAVPVPVPDTIPVPDVTASVPDTVPDAVPNAVSNAAACVIADATSRRFVFSYFILRTRRRASATECGVVSAFLSSVGTGVADDATNGTRAVLPDKLSLRWCAALRGTVHTPDTLVVRYSMPKTAKPTSATAVVGA
jgi:hypothetical protein